MGMASERVCGLLCVGGCSWLAVGLSFVVRCLVELGGGA